MENIEKVKKFSETIKTIKAEIHKDVVGQEDIVDNVIIAIISGGNVLLEGVPGVGKTRLVRTLGKTLSLPFSRIQFTPDLMPSDVTGTNIIQKDETGKMKMVFQKGPIFANLVLADEINRATPKTQSAMLEVMQEHKVTIANQTYKMAEPFFVLATQNPIEQEGTYLLSEAQQDRFIIKENLHYPTANEELEVLNRIERDVFEHKQKVVSLKDIKYLQELCKKVYMDDSVKKYLISIVYSTRNASKVIDPNLAKYVTNGASTRASIAFMEAGKALALINGRTYVTPDDIKALSYSILRHRISLNFEALADEVKVETIIDAIISSIKVP